MKNIIKIFAVIIAAAFVSCEPVENRNGLSGRVTQAEIEQHIKVETEMRNGVRSNFLLIDSEGLNALTIFEHGMGSYIGKKARVMGFVVPGDHVIKVHILNRDGSRDSKEINVTVDECFDLHPAWDIFWGESGSKTWTWDDQQSGEVVFGNGGYRVDNGPAWWRVPIEAPPPPGTGDLVPGEGRGATMTFKKGAVMTKERTNGTSETGDFILDMTQTISGWSIGKVNFTNTTVLLGTNQDAYSFDILKLTETEMVLASAPEGTAGGGPAFFWMFRAVE